MRIGRSIFLVVCPLLVLLSPVIASAQDTIEVSASSAQINFPSEITFPISARSQVTINDIRLRYRIDQLGFAQVINETYLEFAAAPSVKAEWTLDVRRTGDIAPGTKIAYWWLITDARGNRLQTDPIEISFDDQSHPWQKLTEGQVTMYWYQGDSTFAAELMNAAQVAIIRLTGETGASLLKPIRIYIYANTNDLRESLVYSTGWEGGKTYLQYPVVVGAVSTSRLAYGKTMITHELSHIVTWQLALNPYGYIPNWLSEGISEYSEGPLDAYYSKLLRNAIAEGKLISVMSLTSQFSADADRASLSYAESFSIVDFLIKSYGQNKISELLAVFKQGSTYDEALQKVYGFDMEGLHSKWASWVTKQ